MSEQDDVPHEGAGGRIWPALALAAAMFVGILAAPTPAGLTPVAQRLAAVVAAMAALWVLQPVPIAATSLLPLVAFPLLGIQTSKAVSQSYIDENVFLFLGGFIISLGIEKWGLHRRIALQILAIVGGSPRGIVLGFMLATGFISMWISNTATTLLMLPIGAAILGSLRELLKKEDGGPLERGSGFVRMETAMLLGIAYASSIGGFTTLVGTPTNVAFQKAWKAAFPTGPALSAGEWMAMFVPLGFVFLVISWAVLTFRMPPISGFGTLGRDLFRRQLTHLGRPRLAEILMMLIFGTAAVLWITRVPIAVSESLAVPGWGPLVEQYLLWLGADAKLASTALHDSTVAMLLAVLMFFIPVRHYPTGKTQFLMDWNTAQTLPWDVVILFGGGFAIAEAFTATGLSVWTGDAMAAMARGWSPLAVVVAITTLMVVLTEFTTNVATLYALMPVLAATTVKLQIDPRMTLLPAAIATSCGFMMPVGTPPNAIVMGTGRLTVRDMCRYGFFLNLLGVLLIVLTAFLLVAPLLKIDLSVMPNWAEPAR